MTTKTNYGIEFGEEFQTHILAVMCQVPGFAMRYRSALDHTFFADKTNRIVAEILLQHIDAEHQLPSRPTLFESIKPRVGDALVEHVGIVLKKLFATNVTDVTAVMRKVVDFGKQQALINAVMASAELLDKGNRQIKPLIDKALMVGEDLLEIGTDYTAEVETRRPWYTDPEHAIAGLRTGIFHLDASLDGGLGRGELGAILAPPGRGKSTTLINIGFGALADVRGLNVVHYSFEMPRKKVLMRYDDRLMGNRVKYKRSDPERYVDDLQKRMKLLAGRLFVKSYPTRSATVSSLRSHLSMLMAYDFRPDVIIVDYADIVKPERRLGDMRHEQAGVYEDLRQLAGELDAVVWTGSQATKAALEKELVTIGDFAESFEKAAIVDAAFGFCQTDDEKIDGLARLFAAKIRNAEDGRTIECEIRRDCCLISSIGMLDSAGTKLSGRSDERLAVDQTTHAATTSATGRTDVTKAKRAAGLVPEKRFVAKKKRKIGARKRQRDLPRKQVEMAR